MMIIKMKRRRGLIIMMKNDGEEGGLIMMIIKMKRRRGLIIMMKKKRWRGREDD